MTGDRAGICIVANVNWIIEYANDAVKVYVWNVGEKFFVVSQTKETDQDRTVSE